jgi:hypothetical protein
MVIAVISAALGIMTMSQKTSIFFEIWFLVLISFSLLLMSSLVFGFLIKILFKSSWLSLTFTSILLAVGSLTYYLYEYKNSYTIYIPENYEGFVRLYISRDHKNDFFINDFGIGYISYRNFKRGIIPTFIKDGVDITEQIGGLSKTLYPHNYNQRYFVDYCRFNVPGTNEINAFAEFNQLVIQNAIDTSRLRLK